MDDTDNKAELPIHLIIGASEYAKIKTETKPRLGKPGEPVGELTKFGWTIILPGSEVETEHLFFAGSSRVDYDKLCSLDILGLGEREVGNQSVFGEFAEQLEQKPEGFFETGLLWKGDCPHLPDNKAGSLARLEKLINRLERDPDLYMKYDQIIQDQKEKGIVEVIRVREAERDVLRFHWVTDMDRNRKETLRFTQVLFGLSQSPFLLGGTIEQLLRSKESEYPEELEELKGRTVKIFNAAGFELHKWHSNDRSLESFQEEIDQCKASSQTYAKQQVGTTSDETKLLGLAWDKREDTLAISFPEMPESYKKDRKIIYRDICEEGLSWDEEITDQLQKRWQRFIKSLPERIEIPRNVTPAKESVKGIDLHAFGDASGNGVSAAVYAVVEQDSGINQGC
eukprot:gene1425-15846_t